MHFALMFKIDVLGHLENVTSGRHFGTFIGCLWDVAAKRKTMKQLTLLCFRHTFDEITLKII